MTGQLTVLEFTPPRLPCGARDLRTSGEFDIRLQEINGMSRPGYLSVPVDGMCLPMLFDSGYLRKGFGVSWQVIEKRAQRHLCRTAPPGGGTLKYSCQLRPKVKPKLHYA